MSVATLRAELVAMTEEPLASELAGLPEGDAKRPTSEALAERHGVSMETFYEAVDDVISASLPLRNSVFYRKWCAREGLRP